MPESKIEPATRLDSFETVSLIEILQKDNIRCFKEMPNYIKNHYQ